MPTDQSSDIITRLLTVQTVDTARAADNPFKLPNSLRADVNADLAELMASETDTAPREGARAGASAGKRAALSELLRQHRGGYRGIAALDETTITDAQRLQVFESYGWSGGEIGDFTDARTVALARLAPTVSAAEVGGNAAWLYPTARLARIAAQLAIIDALESTASGADRQAATLRRDTALGLAATTLLRTRFFYCSATRDADATPELVRLGYQPRRAPGEGGDGGEPDNGGGGGPTVPGKAAILNIMGGDTATVTIQYDAAGATVFDVFVKVPASNDYTLAAGEIAEKEFTFTNVSGAPWFVKVVGKNAQGAGQESDEANFSGPV